MLEDIQAGLLEDLLQLAEIVGAPVAAQAGGVAEDGVAGRAGSRIDDIDFHTDSAARQQGVAAQLNAIGVGVIRQGSESLDVGGRVVLGVKAAAEGEDDHLETDLRTLVHRRLHRFVVGVAHVHEDRILGNPGGNGSVHAAHGETAALAFGAVVEEQKGAEGGQRFTGWDVDIRSPGRSALQQDWGLKLIVDLGGVLGVRHPLSGDVGAAGGHAVEGVVALHVNGGMLPVILFVHARLVVDDGEDLVDEGVEPDRRAAVIADRQPGA